MNAQVMPGYKLTEVGVIPEDWEIVALGNMSEFITSGSRGWARYYSGYGALFVRSQNVRDGRLDLTDSQFVNPPPGSEGSRTRVKLRDLLITITGNSVGNVALVEHELGETYISQHVGLVRLREPLSGQYVCRFLSPGSLGNGQISGSQSGQSKPGLTLKDLHGFWIALPPLPEQRAIVAALSDMDALIVGLDQLIAKKRDIKQAAMQQLLTGKQRLPGFTGEWEVKTLFEIAERKKELFDDGDWIESEHITNQGVRLIQTGNIGVGRFIEKDVRKYIYEKSFTSLRCKELRCGDLLLCRLADPAGRACVLPDIGEEKIVTSVDVTIFRAPTDTIDRVFLSNLFSTPEWFRAVSDRSGGTTHKRISRGALGRISIKIPAIREQAAIATILSDMDSELTALEARRDKARQIKQGMMQELLTGRIRLTNSVGRG